MKHKVLIAGIGVCVMIYALLGHMQGVQKRKEDYSLDNISAQNVEVSGGESLKATFPSVSDQALGYRVSYSQNEDMSDAVSTTLFRPCVDLPYTEYEYWNTKTYEKTSMSLTVDNLASGTYYWKVDVLKDEANVDDVMREGLTSGQVTVKNETTAFKAVKTYDLGDGFTLDVDKDKNAELKGEGECPEINAAKIKGMPLKEISYMDYIFTDEGEFADLKSLRVEEGITGLKGFQNSAIKTLILPDSLEVLHKGDNNYSFQFSPNLERIVYGTGLKTIEENVFEGCPALRSLIFPEGVTSINSLNCPQGVERIVFPASLREYNFDFTGLTNVRDLVIGEGATARSQIWPNFGTLDRVVNRSGAPINMKKSDAASESVLSFLNSSPVNWVVAGFKRGVVTHGINWSNPKTYKITYDLKDGMSLIGEKSTYRYKEQVTLPKAVYKNYDFVGWRWNGEGVAFHEFKATGNHVGKVKLVPVFEDFEVTGGETLTWTAKDTPYSCQDDYTYILFYGKEGEEEDGFKIKFAEAKNSVWTKEIKGLDAGTYHYRIRVWCTNDDEEFYWCTTNITDFDHVEVPLNEEPVEEGEFVIE